MTEHHDETDVLIIGAGMAGGALAKLLSDGGARVVCLEQGRSLQPEEFRHASETWELDKTRYWNTAPNVRRWDEDYPVAGRDADRIWMMSTVGGSLNHYSGHWPRFKPCDFRKGTEHGLAPDWPLTYEDLEPYYDLNDREMGVSGMTGDPAYPPKSPRGTRPLPLANWSRTLARGFETLGWHWWYMDNAIITEEYDGRLPCNNCGQCRLGCPRGSLSTTATGYWPKALRNGARLVTGARVERILTSGGRARGAEYVDLATGHRHRQDARIVIIAGNGIGTPRLLLLSASAEHPDGLANSSGLVGRNLMFHPQAFVEGYFDEPMEGYKGARGCPVYSHEFYETDPSRGFVNGFSFLVVNSPGAGLAAMGHAASPPVAWGAGHHEDFARRFNHHAYIITMAEDLPLERNRITLDDTLTDSSGLPAPRVRYRMDDQDRRLTEFAVARSEEVLRAAGAHEVQHSGVFDQPPGYHLMGTARMGTDPAASVTNRWHQTWDVPNLFVCDGSSFVTSAGVNPTPTIGALACRLADFLLAEGDTVVRENALVA
ncbi:GMC family oxidoreductase [Streptomyces sp. NPDC004838]